jgi:hypothetical protein
VDEDFGPFFIKFCSYFPHSAKLYLNANHWAQRQAEKAGIGFTPMDNAYGGLLGRRSPSATRGCCGR